MELRHENTLINLTKFSCKDTLGYKLTIDPVAKGFNKKNKRKTSGI